MSIISYINENYSSESGGVRKNLYRILNNGLLSETGKLMILPVDQGFEHGPDRSFAINSEGYDPDYHAQLAIDGGFNAYAAPIGMLQQSDKILSTSNIPTILKINSSNFLLTKDSKNNQAITSTVEDAVRLGCSAIGLTIYPGSEHSISMIEQAKELINEARYHGLASVVWSYARGDDISKDKNMETALDIIAYSAHIAALIGAHIIKVKPPFNSDENGMPFIYDKEIRDKKLYDVTRIGLLSERIKIVKKACFNGRKIVIFSGGAAKKEEDILSEINAIHQGGGNGSIVGRNMFQRPKNDALALANKIASIYKSK